MSEALQLQPVPIEPGVGSFIFDQFADGDHQPLRVHYFWPRELEEDAPIVFVMHGLLRDGDQYRDRWSRHAERHGFLLIAPEFDRDFYPSVEDYNLGGLVDDERDKEFNREETWAFAKIEQLFGAIKVSSPFAVGSFGIYGHSAGAQFVHRLVLFHPEASFHAAVAANAGWYTLPCQETDFPYGVGDAPVSDSRLAQALQKELVILLGEEDRDETHPNLRRTPEAVEQGKHRLARGHSFLEAGGSASERLGVEFAWKLKKVPGAAHRDSSMSGSAVSYLLGRRG